MSSESAPAWPAAVRGSTPPTTLEPPPNGTTARFASAAMRNTAATAPSSAGIHDRLGNHLDLAAAQAEQIGKAATDRVRDPLEGAGANAVFAAGGAQSRQHVGRQLGRRQADCVEFDGRDAACERATEAASQLGEQHGFAAARHLGRLAEPPPAIPAQRLTRDHGRLRGPIRPAVSRRCASLRIRSSL